MNDKIHTYARILWNYNHLNHVLKPSDILICLGSHDLRVADHTAKLYLEGFAPTVLFSGGYGRGTSGVFSAPEAQLLAERAVSRGVPESVILVEDKSSNTGENILFSKSLLEERGMSPRSAILVQKPYMERRTYATCKKQWPELDILVSSPQISYEKYPNEHISREECINIMVGDTERIIEYPKLGFQITQEVPELVLEAYKKLIEFGFTDQLMKRVS